MQLLDLAPELVERIFESFALSREFKRFMRLRLVSREFKYFIDGTICRLRLLDDLPEITTGLSDPRHCHWRAFVLQYLAYQAWIEKQPKSLLGRIRRAAVILSEQVGETERGAVFARLESLCCLVLDHRTWLGHDRALFRSPTWPWTVEYSDEQLEADICVAAIYMGHRAHVEELISQGRQFCNWEGVKDVVSGVFGPAYKAATLAGDVSTLRLLLSSNPNYSPSRPPPSSLRLEMLKNAATFGHEDAFDFALDSGPLDLVRGERENSRGFPEYHSVMEAVAKTRVPGNYRRAASMFLPNSKIFSPQCGGSPLDRLGQKAEAGYADMVQYFLGQGVSPNHERGRDKEFGDTNRKYQPLLRGVEGGNPDVVRLLLDHGADPNWLPVVNTALMAAVKASAISIARMLLAAGARVDEGCPPPIVLAVFKEDMDMFRLLRKYGARLDTPETGGWAMAVAQFYELESMVDVLVEEGVERGAILRRCAEHTETYQRWYLFPQCALAPEELWWQSLDCQ